MNFQRFRQKIGIGVEVSTPDQQEETLEHRRQADRQHDNEDQRFTDQGAKENSLDQNPEQEAPDQRQKKCRQYGKFCPGDQGKKKICADCKQLAMGKVEDAGGFEDHHESHRRKAIEKADRKAADQQLNKKIHAIFLS